MIALVLVRVAVPKRTRLVRVFAFLDQPEGVPVYPPEIRQVILDRIAAGESLRRVCERDDMPAISSVQRWLDEDAEFQEQYARAVEMRADAKFEELDDVSEEAVSADSAVKVQGLRLKADNIKWQLARMSPRKYGDKVAHTGADGGDIQHSIKVSFG